MVSLNGSKIEITNMTKRLGLTIDGNLCWNIPISKICYRMRSLSPSTIETIHNQGILPSVLYGIVWGNCAPNLLNDIEKIHIKAARYIRRIKKRGVPDREVLSAAHWPLLQETVSLHHIQNLSWEVFTIATKTDRQIQLSLENSQRLALEYSIL